MRSTKNLLPTVLETKLNIFFKKQSLAYANAELKGLINSIFNKPSNYRPYKKINN